VTDPLNAPGRGAVRGCPGAGGSLPELEIEALTFLQNRRVLADLPKMKVSAPEWRAGPEPTAWPVCYLRAGTVTLKATFRVVRAPSETVTVAVRGNALVAGRLHEWAGPVTVAPDSSEAETAALASTETLPDEVRCFDPMKIVWEYGIEGRDGWREAGVTELPMYTLLGSPRDTDALYWTVLHMSCSAAEAAGGVATEAALEEAVFGAFRPAHPNERAVRRRDRRQLAYWRDDAEEEPVQSLDALMASDDGNGSCRAWGELLLAMYRIHGIADGYLVGIENRHSFRSTATTMTLAGIENANGLGMRVRRSAGQNNADPQTVFTSHFVVRAPSGRYYDPSYGTEAFGSVHEWKWQALDCTLLPAGRQGWFEAAATLRPAQPATVEVGSATIGASAGTLVRGAVSVACPDAALELTLSAGCTVTDAAGEPVPLGAGAHTLAAGRRLGIPADGTAVLVRAARNVTLTAARASYRIGVPARGELSLNARRRFTCSVDLEFREGAANEFVFFRDLGNVVVETG
jgi:hypothetical protein